MIRSLLILLYGSKCVHGPETVHLYAGLQQPRVFLLEAESTRKDTLLMLGRTEEFHRKFLTGHLGAFPLVTIISPKGVRYLLRVLHDGGGLFRLQAEHKKAVRLAQPIRLAAVDIWSSKG